MSGIVFIDKYKSRNIAATPILNLKYLIYMATREGAIKNKGCDFSLWGRLPHMVGAENINDLELAKHTITEASAGHTVYRAIFSVDGETADQHGLYERSAWERLVYRKIDVIAKEKDINHKDFCWAASMHYVKGHPHVHIMYWDNSDRVRQEKMPEERFKIFVEHVRAEFDRELNQSELESHRTERKEIVSAARLQLQAMCKEANLAEALNLKRVTKAKVNELGEAFAALALDMPERGALKYAYLPRPYKEKVNTFLDRVMSITEFGKLREHYLKLTDEISDLYGNGAERKKFNHEKALTKLYTDLGNSVMAVLKEYRDELKVDVPAGMKEFQSVVQEAVSKIMLTNPHYEVLKTLMPKLRTPMEVIESGSKRFREEKETLVKELCRDLRVRTIVNQYIKVAWPEACRERGLSEEEGKEQFAGEVRSNLYRTADAVVWSQLQNELGYRDQYRVNLMVNMLVNLFRVGSQNAGQARSQRDLSQHRHELSKTARRDRQKRQSQAGNWTMEQ